jgi:hypothetical protein
VMREHGTTPDEIEWPALDVIALEPAASIV